ncbi:MAG: NUDIX hydrolase [Clostridia bacterium]|nr:NUDIX hydrolase [Clostridia bacterium]
MNLTEKTLSSVNAFDGHILHLCVDTVELPDGQTATRKFIKHPGGVAVVALTEDRQVLLVRQYRYPYGEVVTEIPAGKRDSGEDPLTTGRRELEEETGYTADTYTSLGTLYPSPGYVDEVIYLYLATGLHPTAAHPDADEFLEVERRPIEELVSDILEGKIPDAKTQTAVLKTYLLLKQKGG